MIFIHNSNRTFHTHWKEACDRLKVEYRSLDIFSIDSLKLIKESDDPHVLVHLGHDDSFDIRYGIRILESYIHAGINVFPGWHSFWHYDDKICQEYIFKLLEINHPNTVVSFKKNLKPSVYDYPIVAKLSGGAGSSNVWLIKNNNC